jgi:hypothetical protein
MTLGSHHLHVFYGADNPPSPTRFYSAPSGNDIECQSPTASGAGVVSNNVP